jgi:hypothetical protein
MCFLRIYQACHLREK